MIGLKGKIWEEEGSDHAYVDFHTSWFFTVWYLSDPKHRQDPETAAAWLSNNEVIRASQQILVNPLSWRISSR